VTFGEALAADLLAGKLANVAELLASGYTPTPDDCAALAQLALNPARKSRVRKVAPQREIRAQARAFYRALRNQGLSADACLNRTRAVVGDKLHPSTIKNVCRKGHDEEAVARSREIRFATGPEGLPIWDVSPV
jgi:hypothetical protein